MNRQIDIYRQMERTTTNQWMERWTDGWIYIQQKYKWTQGRKDNSHKDVRTVYRVMDGKLCLILNQSIWRLFLYLYKHFICMNVHFRCSFLSYSITHVIADDCRRTFSYMKQSCRILCAEYICDL